MKKILNDLYLIDLDQPITGFRNFISCWLVQKNGLNILIDPGPSSTILYLSSILKKAGVKQIDLILLTHIHIDHAGGTGLLLKKFPQARVICHPKAIKHLVNPEKLWNGSLAVLGKLADVYGLVPPVPEINLIFQPEFKINDLNIKAFETPGHAPHHLVFQIEDLLFIGEVAGVHIPIPGGFYLRMATPPVFKYEIYKNSLQKAARLQARQLCFGHYGYHKDPSFVFSQALKQLELWMEIIGQMLEKGITQEQKIFSHLLNVDPLLASFQQLPLDIQEREHYFAQNSIKGIKEYLLSESTSFNYG